MKNKRLLSLFSGCGGMDIGFEGNFNATKKLILKHKYPNWIQEETDNYYKLTPTIFNTIFANDILPEAKTAWVNYFSETKTNANNIYHLKDITQLMSSKLYLKFPSNVDIITGGFPCQDFSIAGKRAGLNSKNSRGTLYTYMKHVIELTNPKIFIAENVKGLVSLNDSKKIIENDFTNINDGYIVLSKILNAKDYGVPQNRERIFFIGFNKNYLLHTAQKELLKPIVNIHFNPFPQKTHALKPVLLKNIFNNLPEPNVSFDDSQKAYSKSKFYGKHCQGNKEIDLNKVSPTIRSEHHGNIEFRRLSKEHNGKNEIELNQGLIERRLSVRECAKIQSFPDNYEFIFSNDNGSVSASKAYKLIGNAVPPLLAYNIAKNIETKWNRWFY